MSTRQQIAEELLGCALVDGQYAPCPGRGKHTKGNGKRDFRVVLDGAPTGYCFHSKCSDDVVEFNKELRRRIWFAEHGDRPAPATWGPGVSAEPRAETQARPELDRDAVEEFIRGVPAVTEDWLRRRSPMDVVGLRSSAFLETLYAPDERVLVFTSQRSQGDFLWWMGRGGYRLSQERGVRATTSALPESGPEGVWYLVQPVTGQWAVNPKAAGPGQSARWTRRSEVNVTGWRYFVLESDELEAPKWLRVVANLQLPIAAIYTSGGRSIHALVKFEVPTKAHWDAVRNQLRQIVCPLGADPAALSAVRLSRLPGCKRGDRAQRLLYLDPSPVHEALRLRREVRE